MLGRIVVGYLLAGVLVEAGEEMWIMKNSKNVFKFDPAEGSKFLDRFDGYNLNKFKRDVLDILSWPYGFVCWRRGVNKVKNLSEEEVKDMLARYKEKFEKEGLM